MDNKNYEIDLLKLFKDGKITQYVLEKEIGKFLSERAEVKVVKCFHHTARTFVVFPAAEVKSNGLYMNVYIDEGALLEALTAEEMYEILRITRDNIQSIFKNYMGFISSSAANSVTVTEVLLEYLKAYENILPYLREANEKSKKVLHSPMSLSEVIEKLDNGRTDAQGIEELIIKDYIPREVLELSERISAASGGESGLALEINHRELPIANLCQSEIRQYAQSSINLDKHREIPHDYKPSTNQ